MNQFNFFISSDYCVNPLSSLHNLFTSVKQFLFYHVLKADGEVLFISLVFSLKGDKELELLSENNDPDSGHF